MTETVAYIRNSLKDIYPPGEAQALVRLIMERVCGLSTHQLLLGKGKELSDTEKFKIKEIVEGLRLYKPIQYLLGIADFYGMEFKVTPDVLIPRPETAELVERIITDYQGQAPRILDIGTGSGCIAISLAKHLPEAEVAAVDISPEALAVAEENARMNQVSVSFHELDILSEGYSSFMQEKQNFHVRETRFSCTRNKIFTYVKLKSHTEETEASLIGSLNCIVSNPPYIMYREKSDHGSERSGERASSSLVRSRRRSASLLPGHRPLRTKAFGGRRASLFRDQRPLRKRDRSDATSRELHRSRINTRFIRKRPDRKSKNMKEITEPEMLHRAAAYCSAAERCIQDVQKKIDAAGLPPDASERIIARLLKERFIDESRYTRFFVNDKLRFNKWGRVKIGYELYKKNIPSPIREESLAAIDEGEYRSILLDLLKSKKKSTKGKDERDLFNKLLRFAAGRGFESRITLDCLSQLFKGTDCEDYADDME